MARAYLVGTVEDIAGFFVVTRVRIVSEPASSLTINSQEPGPVQIFQTEEFSDFNEAYTHLNARLQHDMGWPEHLEWARGIYLSEHAVRQTPIERYHEREKKEKRRRLLFRAMMLIDEIMD
jgi:hypothetical protein